MIIVFITELILLGVVYLYTVSKFEIPPEVGTGRLKNIRILSVTAFFIVNTFISGHFTAYERKLSSKLAELHGGIDIKHRVMAHLVEKTVALIISILVVTVLGAFLDVLDLSYVVFAISVILAVFYSGDRELAERVKKRNFYIQYDFPDFLNKLVLLINAGMTVPRAWEKIVCDRENMTPLYEELNITYLEIRNGKPELAAYEDFARRCRVKEITKFVTAIIQNLRKGNSELVLLLKLQSNECWQLRKAMARKLGEEASTKLVFPLMIMFLGILIIVMLPAVMQLKFL